MTPEATLEATIEQLVSALEAATPAVPEGNLTPAELADLGALVVARRQPLLDALLAKLAAGAELDQVCRARLQTLEELNVWWQQAMGAAQTEILRQIQAVKRMSSEARGNAPLARAYLHVEA